MTESRQGYVKQTTLLTAVMISLGVGFLAGVVWSAYKTAPASGPVHNHDNDSAEADIEKMMAALEKQAAQEPDNIEILIQLGHLYFDHNKPKKAIDAYQKVLTLDPKNANILTDLGVMYRRAQQPEKAIDAFEKAVEADPKHETARFNRGVVLMHDLNRPAEAIAAWKALGDVNPLFTAPNGMTLDELISHYENEDKR